MSAMRNDLIESVTIEGFKSIKSLNEFSLRRINVLIGANGSGKSNFLSFFQLATEIGRQSLQYYAAKTGGPEAYLHLGSKETKRIIGRICFEPGTYQFVLEASSDNRLILAWESAPIRTMDGHISTETAEGGLESNLIGSGEYGMPRRKDCPRSFLSDLIQPWANYHFHDTSDTAWIKKRVNINDSESLHKDAGNLAPFLLRIRSQHEKHYMMIRDTVRLVAPFFDDFVLRRVSESPEQIQLEWKQKHSKSLFLASQVSDGMLRFICLATALLQPELPSLILIDEPELGLHPDALAILSGLIRQASSKAQIIISTQSADLVDHFEPEDIVVVERQGDESIFRRLNPEKLTGWLEDYSLGELWQKNVLDG